ncbi:MAG: CorA family divalent cation transporter [Bacteroidia bacterium]|nr:magnesium transporter CorA [Bacteroidia bacterium]MDW8157632.1 CorA family divalent cation transporter [Bacteroidia bacterium]
MIREIYRAPDDSFRWINIINPEPSELERLAQEYELHETSVEDCLTPNHLPKIEKIGDIVFTIIRPYDEQASRHADTVFDLTRKISIFCGNNFLITIHRGELPFFELFIKYWLKTAEAEERNSWAILGMLLDSVAMTYQQPLEDFDRTLDMYEDRIFEHKSIPFTFRQIHILKRRAIVIKKMLRMTAEITRKIEQKVSRGHDPFYQNIREEIQNLYFLADGIVENCNNLLNIYLSISTHRTNEIIRFLTVFSVFFMPLTFIVGIYGMNFENMPELKHPYGYPAVMILMALISLGIYLYFRAKGWLR